LISIEDAVTPGGGGRIRLGAGAAPTGQPVGKISLVKAKANYEVNRQLRSIARVLKESVPSGIGENILWFSPSRVVALCASPRHQAFKVFSMNELRVTDPNKLIVTGASGRKGGTAGKWATKARSREQAQKAARTRWTIGGQMR
jgi:hypothetical protein